MGITNVHGLPEPLVAALTPERRRVVPGRISVTSLIDSPLRRLLMMQHFDEIEEDASENLWSLLGKAVHYVIEKGNEDTEIKLEVPWRDPIREATLVGIVDYHANGEVIDWKVTSVWSAIFAADKNWELQLQTYAYLLYASTFPVTKLSVYMILRDWNKRERQKNPDYPEIPFKKLSYEPWPIERQEAYVSERVSLHLSAEKIVSGASSCEIQPIPENLWCTPEERWAKPDKYAAKKPGQDRAVKLFDNEKECSDFIHGTPMYLEHRKGEQTKCESYCAVEKWCPYRKSLQT